jgi:protein SCO1
MHIRYLVLFVFVVFIVAACQKTETKSASAEAKRYPFKGKVVAVNKEKKTATIEHDEIPGYMEAMTMDFPIHEDWVWNDLTPGSEVRADLVVDNSGKDPYWLEKIGIIAAPDPNRPALPENEKFAQIGKPVPDFQLINQDGKRISMRDFRGKALAVTFIYAQCPLPDYCIKMSANFSDLANHVASDPAEKEKIKLLSISFDPERDTPEKLKSYGIGYLGRNAKAGFSTWQLAVGSDQEVRAIADFFGLRYEVDPNDKTQIIHSLRTAVISPDGKVTKIFSGNDWTPNDLLRELKAALLTAE